MDEGDPQQHHRAFERLLEPGERVSHATTAGGMLLAVTDRRVAILVEDRTALDVPLEGLRRIQFDIETGRPATLVIVPSRPEHFPQVLSVEPHEYEPVAAALVTIGHRLAQAS